MMATLDPNALAPSNKHTLSICQSKRVIDDLELSLSQENYEENSSLLFTNRQIYSGMILDARQFDKESKIMRQLVCKNGEDDENVIFSFMVLREENGSPKEIIYRWVRRPRNELSKGSGVVVREEEHIYQGEMKGNRKHGPGEYIIIKKLSNATERQIRYRGTWNLDIFDFGTIEDENGQIKEMKSNYIPLKSKTSFRGKKERNETIKVVAAEMEKKKSSKLINDSFSSIKEKIAQPKLSKRN